MSLEFSYAASLIVAVIDIIDVGPKLFSSMLILPKLLLFIDGIGVDVVAVAVVVVVVVIVDDGDNNEASRRHNFFRPPLFEKPNT